MKRFMWCAIVSLVSLAWANVSMAQSMDFDLKAGSSSVAGGASYLKPLNSGYMKLGISGVYSDDDTTSYQWGSLHLLVGSDTLSPGLQAEVGLKGIFGSAEERSHSGDIGVLAFTGRLGYIFPRRIIPIPLEVFGGLSYAPDPLSYMDTESYMELMLGIGIRIIDQASLEISFHQYDIDMEEGPGSWELDDSEVRFGISMRF